MTDHWERQPRVPAGHPDGGQWTEAERAARRAADLPEREYTINSIYEDKASKVTVVKGGDKIPDSLSDILYSHEDDPVRVIYNVPTNRWHISNDPFIEVQHADFLQNALEGLRENWPTEYVQVRGLFDISTGELVLYDMNDQIDWIISSPTQRRFAERKINEGMTRAESRPFYYRGRSGRVRKARVVFEAMGKMLGW